MENAVAFQIEHGIPIPTYPRPKEGPRGSCKCGGVPREGYKCCDKCLESTKRQRRDRINDGLCEYFGCDNPPQPERTSCQFHLNKMLAYSMALRAQRQKTKVCIDCGKHPQWWTQRCVICRSVYSDGLPQGALSALRRYRRFQAIDERREQAERAVKLIENDRKRLVIDRRHGLSDGIDHTLEEIGAELSITRERVRQIESRTLRELEKTGFDVGRLRLPFVAVQRPKARTRPHASEHRRKQEYAHRQVADALKSGALEKRPCQDCGRIDVIAHHPDYDKPLEVEWLCRPHHMAAHGRGKGSKRQDKVPAPKGPRLGWWLKKVEPSNEHYDAASIVASLRAHNVKQKTVCEATGLYSPTLNLIVRGQQVKDEQLLAVLRFVNELNARPVSITI